MIKPYHLAFSALLLSLSSGTRSEAGLINGGFENPDVTNTLYQTFQPGVGVLQGWTVEAGSVDVQKGGYQGMGSSEGNQYLDLNGFSAGRISQVITSSVQTTYRLSFDYSGYFDPGFGSSAGNTLFYELFDGTTGAVLSSGSHLLQTSELLRYHSIAITATATSTLLGVRFRSDGQSEGGTTFVGPVIDRVSLEAIASVPVPEPSTLMMTSISGLLAIVARRKSR